MAVSCTAHQTGLPTSEQYEWLMEAFGGAPKWFIETPVAKYDNGKGYYHLEKAHQFGEMFCDFCTKVCRG